MAPCGPKLSAMPCFKHEGLSSFQCEREKEASLFSLVPACTNVVKLLRTGARTMQQSRHLGLDLADSTLLYHQGSWRYFENGLRKRIENGAGLCLHHKSRNPSLNSPPTTTCFDDRTTHDFFGVDIQSLKPQAFVETHLTAQFKALSTDTDTGLSGTVACDAARHVHLDTHTAFAM